MNITSIPSIISALACLGLGVFVLSRNPRRPVNIGFTLGILALAVTEFCAFMIGVSIAPAGAIFWGKVSLVGAAFLPGSWLLFSLTFARADARLTLRRWRPFLAGFFFIPLSFLCLLGSPLFLKLIDPDSPTSYLPVGNVGYAFFLFLLVTLVVVLMNLEQTFRASSGLSRWQIKYLILGTGAIVALEVYTAGQTILFSAIRLDLFPIHSTSLLAANLLVLYSLIRHRLLEVNLFVSRYIIYKSTTLLLAGIYLFIVGLIVFGIQRIGGEAYLSVVPFIVFISLLGLMILFLSDQLRRTVKTFINVNFYKNKHDYRMKWQEFTKAVGTKLTLHDLIPSLTAWLIDTIGANEVAIWLLDQKSSIFSEQYSVEGRARKLPCDSSLAQFLEESDGVLVSQEMFQNKEWLNVVKENSAFLDKINWQVLLPIRTGTFLIGFVSLGNKITNEKYDYHDLELLKTICDQTAGQIERVRFSEELSSAREMEAFHTLSSFFVHDLKNHTATLSLLAQNAAVHGDNPEFQKDAIKTIRETANKMNHLIKHVSVASKGLMLSRSEVDLNNLIKTVCSSLNGSLSGKIHSHLDNLPTISADPDQLSTVIRNLLTNASEAIDGTGKVTINTWEEEDMVFFSVVDNGCGISAEFIATSLFKPLRTTKPAGWGIGLFQCRQIIKAHGGKIDVESEKGKGTKFRVTLPIRK